MQTCTNSCAKQRRKRRLVRCNKQPPQSHFCPAAIVHTLRIDRTVLHSCTAIHSDNNTLVHRLFMLLFLISRISKTEVLVYRANMSMWLAAKRALMVSNMLKSAVINIFIMLFSCNVNVRQNAVLFFMTLLFLVCSCFCNFSWHQSELVCARTEKDVLKFLQNSVSQGCTRDDIGGNFSWCS